MQIRKISPAREFPVGNGDVVISHCANLILDSDEQVTFLTGDGKEYDVVRKPWGYYATPSLNSRLKRNGLRAGLTRSIQSGLFFVVLVDDGHSEEWLEYCTKEGQELVTWLDSDDFLKSLSSK